MKTSLAIVLAVAALISGATVSLNAGTLRRSVVASQIICRVDGRVIPPVAALGFSAFAFPLTSPRVYGRLG